MTTSPKLVAIASWLRQTSTIVGIATLGGTIAAVVAKQMTWAEAVPVAVGGLISIAIPGHPDTQAAATNAATDAVKAIQSKGLGTSLPALGADLVTLAGMLPDNTPVVAVQHTVTPIAPSAVPAAPAPAPAAAMSATVTP